MALSTPTLDRPDVAHVGYHRTGTNLLQNHVFPALREHLFMPSNSGWHLFRDPESFDEAAARVLFARAWETLDEPQDRRLMLISSERLTGTAETDDPSTAEKLHRLNPEMRIILVLRSQLQMFPSLYHLHVKRNGGLDYEGFVRRLLDGNRCRYRVMVERFFELFGRERVLVLLYEDLVEDADAFIGQICRFLEVPGDLAPRLPDRINARRSDSVLSVGSWTNRLLDAERHPANWKAALRQGAMELAQQADFGSRRIAGRPLWTLDRRAGSELIQENYAEENQRAGALIGRDLGDHGYPA